MLVLTVALMMTFMLMMVEVICVTPFRDIGVVAVRFFEALALAINEILGIVGTGNVIAIRLFSVQLLVFAINELLGIGGTRKFPGGGLPAAHTAWNVTIAMSDIGVAITVIPHMILAAATAIAAAAGGDKNHGAARSTTMRSSAISCLGRGSRYEQSTQHADHQQDFDRSLHVFTPLHPQILEMNSSGIASDLS
jgi:hypothetical protein